jgi:hypothetical protein
MRKSKSSSLPSSISIEVLCAAVRFNNSIELDRLQAALAGALRGVAAPAATHVNR